MRGFLKLALTLSIITLARGHPHSVDEGHQDFMKIGLDEVLVKPESTIQYIFNKLFPFGPAGNAILATTYISGPPNLILALIPSNIDVSSLNLLVSFAIGGLLGDVFLHLLPETFTGQSVDLSIGTSKYVLVDDRKNIILGLGMFFGFLLFFVIDKTMRILENDGSEEHGHSHSHTHSTVQGAEGDSANGNDNDDDKEKEKEINPSVKTSAYLNLISDFTHNITDGLAISSSFYISKSVGSTTAIATFMHEIPHEVGDFALLIQGGFSKWQAMGAQFVTAVGAYVGTFIGIALQQSLETHLDSSVEAAPGLFGTSLQMADMTLPFTAGGFFYIAFSVIPELLEGERGVSRCHAAKQFLLQLLCMLSGIGFMAFIALNE